MQTVLATLDGQPLFLAQPDIQTTESTAAPGENGEGGDTNEAQPQGFNPMNMMLIFGAVILFMFLLGGGGGRKARKKQQEMLSAMSKGDKVVTIGGIRGSVVEVRDSEVVVKVDENNNTRMKFSREAIREVVSDKDEVDEK